MKDKIKGILDDLRSKDCYINNEITLSFDEASQIVDYITNLQEENKKSNNIINELEKFFKYAYDNEVKPLNDRKISVWTICLDKIKELKENK